MKVKESLLETYNTLLYKCLYNRVFQIADDKTAKKMCNIIEKISVRLAELFKSMYKYEYMLHLLSVNTYTDKDSIIKQDIIKELNDVCDALIPYMLVAIKYRTLLMVTQAYKYINFEGKTRREIYKSIMDEIKLNLTTSIELYNALSSYIEQHPEFTDLYFKQPITDFYSFFINIVSNTWSVADWEIINRFANKYECVTEYNSFTLQEKICDINELKHHSHHFGTLLNDTRGDDRYYFFSTMTKEQIDQITNINEKVVEKELQKLVGY